MQTTTSIIIGRNTTATGHPCYISEERRDMTSSVPYFYVLRIVLPTKRGFFFIVVETNNSEKNPLFAAKPRFRELWGREKMGKGEKKRGKKKREREERRITVAATDNDGTNALSLKPQHDPAVNL
jgi:hypothetical protein